MHGAAHFRPHDRALRHDALDAHHLADGRRKQVPGGVCVGACVCVQAGVERKRNEVCVYACVWVWLRVDVCKRMCAHLGEIFLPPNGPSNAIVNTSLADTL